MRKFVSSRLRVWLGICKARPIRLIVAFTLIELLIVVAIIAILAAIAVPNFLEAQVRAKTSRAKADMRSLKTALETYRIDNNKYMDTMVGVQIMEFAPLTTPIAYMSSVPLDPFPNKNTGNFPAYWYEQGAYEYVRYVQEANGDLTLRWDINGAPNIPPVGANYFLLSNGPDRRQSTNYGNTIPFALLPYGMYDPTNGTVSFGDIFCYGAGGVVRLN